MVVFDFNNINLMCSLEYDLIPKLTVLTKGNTNLVLP